ncbi:MAG: tetratricopeptide repeat protein [Bacteroidales bacterium]|nr:tetratricopeptide repeat protein [Bacteroidales bacterium]
MRIKNLIIFVLIILLGTAAYSQQTEGEVELSYSTISGIQSKLSDVTGWSLQDNGRWASEKNIIPFSNYKTKKRPTAKFKLGQENFTEIQLRRVLIDDIQYNVLIIEYQDGKYEFPLLEEGWRSYLSASYYVFKAKNLLKVLPEDVKFNESYAINLDVYCYGEEKNYDPEIISNKIVNKITKTQALINYNQANLVWAVYPIFENGEKNCRFKFIKSYVTQHLYSFYTDPRHRKELFKRSFYETNYHKFKNFIRSAQQSIIPMDGQLSEFQNHYNIGMLNYQSGNFDIAVEEFNEALKFKPNSNISMLYSFRGISKLKLNQFNQAIEDFDKAIDMKPKEVAEYSNWIKNYFNRGVARFYIDDFEGACQDWNKSFELGFGIALEYLNKYCAY